MEYSPEKIIAFEPFPAAVASYCKNMQQHGFSTENYEICIKALGNQEGVLRYNPEEIKLDQNGNTQVEITTLDNFFAQRQECKIGFLKADLEGFGLDMLKGGIETIKRTRPVLSLACYHTPEELFGQYQFLKKELSNYNFCYTSLPPGKGYELTLLAIPAEAEQ
jgi:FkbM family methyltransferase